MPIRLLSTDFDGTLIGHEPDARTAASLAEALSGLRAAGAVWAVNTGRQLWFALEGLEHAHLPHDPDYVLTSEKDIFRRVGEGDWEAFGDWNARTEERTADLFGRAGHVLDAIGDMVATEDGLEILYENGRIAGLMTSDAATMDVVAARIVEVAADVPEFSFNRNDVWMRFAHREIHKGSSLAELARLLGIPREEVLAIGDHHNDIPMLDGTAAGMVACPANAVDKVKRLVLEQGGYVSPQSWGEGVADAIRHFTGVSGSVPTGRGMANKRPGRGPRR
jgi:HAD superfamily hydrolase (TIGR01484 family)